MQVVREFNLPDGAERGRRTYTLQQGATAEGRYQTLERFAVIQLLIEPYAGRSQFLLEWRVDNDQIPLAYLPAVMEGIQDAAGGGTDGKRPITGVRITVVGGAVPDHCSTHLSYRIAAFRAFKQAVADAGVIEADA